MSKFVCCTVSLHEAAEGGREAGEAAPNAFMISDMVSGRSMREEETG